MKYEFTGETKIVLGTTFKRIRRIAHGEVGGWIENETNLNQSGNAWVYDNARVWGDARVSGAAQVYDNARVYGNAQVSGNARVWGDARVSGAAQVYDNAQVYGNARVLGNARVWGDARVSGAARVYGNADFLLVGPIGSRRSFLTITADAKIKVRFTTGCFSGSRKQLIAAIKKTHKPTSRYAKEYAAALVMAKLVKAMKG